MPSLTCLEPSNGFWSHLNSLTLAPSPFWSVTHLILICTPLPLIYLALSTISLLASPWMSHSLLRQFIPCSLFLQTLTWLIFWLMQVFSQRSSPHGKYPLGNVPKNRATITRQCLIFLMFYFSVEHSHFLTLVYWVVCSLSSSYWRLTLGDWRLCPSCLVQ